MSLPFHAAEEVLDLFQKRFISDMDAAAVVFDLVNKGTIDKGVKKDIRKESNPEEQNKILYETLMDKCTYEHLMDACDIIIAVKGNPKMKAFGEAMKRELVASKCVCSVQGYVHVCAHSVYYSMHTCILIMVWAQLHLVFPEAQTVECY